jgi:hypothetical protein
VLHASENELQAKLDVPAFRGAGDPPKLRRAKAGVRGEKVRVIETIEEFCAESKPNVFPKGGFL